MLTNMGVKPTASLSAAGGSWCHAALAKAVFLFINLKKGVPGNIADLKRAVLLSFLK